MNDPPSRVMAVGRADLQGLQLLESCLFRWIFDGATRRFRRTPRHAMVWVDSTADWTEYHRLDIDDAHACFVVSLDEARTRVLRAWIHTDPCRRCQRNESSTGLILGWKKRVRIRDARLALDHDGGGHPLRPYGGWAGPEDVR